MSCSCLFSRYLYRVAWHKCPVDTSGCYAPTLAVARIENEALNIFRYLIWKNDYCHRSAHFSCICTVCLIEKIILDTALFTR